MLGKECCSEFSGFYHFWKVSKTLTEKSAIAIFAMNDISGHCRPVRTEPELGPKSIIRAQLVRFHNTAVTGFLLSSTIPTGEAGVVSPAALCGSGDDQ